MKKSLHRLVCGISLVVIAATVSLHAEVEGIYVLEDSDENRFKWKQPELTIKVDDEGEFSATLIAGKVTETDDISGEANEFEATFTISTNMGDMDITYAGRVEQGKLSGTITESMFGTEVELVGALKKEDKVD